MGEKVEQNREARKGLHELGTENKVPSSSKEEYSSDPLADVPVCGAQGTPPPRASQEYFIDNSSLRRPLSCRPLGMLQ